jgi:hypothetical protein
MPDFAAPTGDGPAFAPSLADDLIAAVETRALWARFGL